jgi:hypothetical protein
MGIFLRATRYLNYWHLAKAGKLQGGSGRCCQQVWVSYKGRNFFSTQANFNNAIGVGRNFVAIVK